MRVTVANPNPAVAPTVVIDVATGTPNTLAIRIPSPIPRKTATLDSSEIEIVTMSSDNLPMTFFQPINLTERQKGH